MKSYKIVAMKTPLKCDGEDKLKKESRTFRSNKRTESRRMRTQEAQDEKDRSSRKSLTNITNISEQTITSISSESATIQSINCVGNQIENERRSSIPVWINAEKSYPNDTKNM